MTHPMFIAQSSPLLPNLPVIIAFPVTQAKLSGALVDLLEQHDQSLDPNLVQLADAWTEAVARAGGEAALEAQLKDKGQGALERSVLSLVSFTHCQTDSPSVR